MEFVGGRAVWDGIMFNLFKLMGKFHHHLPIIQNNQLITTLPNWHSFICTIQCLYTLYIHLATSYKFPVNFPIYLSETHGLLLDSRNNLDSINLFELFNKVFESCLKIFYYFFDKYLHYVYWLWKRIKHMRKTFIKSFKESKRRKLTIKQEIYQKKNLETTRKPWQTQNTVYCRYAHRR